MENAVPNAGVPALRAYRLSVVLIVASAAAFSLGGLIIRHLEASAWQIAFYRGLALAAAISIGLALQHRGDAVSVFRGIGLLGLCAGLFLGMAPVTYIIAMQHTSIANANFVMAGLPFFTAVLARVMLGERVPFETMMYIVIAFCGIVMMVAEGFSTGTFFGSAMALATALTFSMFVILLRRKKTVNMVPVVAVSGLSTAIIGLAVSGGALGVRASDLVLCLIWGGLIAGVGHLLFVLASRHLAGAEITFVMLAEFALAPVWVWVFIDETPTTTTLIGGAVVVGSVACWSYESMRGARGLVLFGHRPRPSRVLRAPGSRERRDPGHPR